MAKKKETENNPEVSAAPAVVEASLPVFKSIGIQRNEDNSYVVKITTISGNRILESKDFNCENRAIAMETFKIKSVQERVLNAE